MTASDFRRLALKLSESVESSQMGHPDFRVKGKIFATLDAPEPGWGMVKLTPEQQQAFVLLRPKAFVPVQGGWGLKGATYVSLPYVEVDALSSALLAAWRNTAPKRLVQQHDESEPAA